MEPIFLLAVMLLSLISRGETFTPPCQWHRAAGENLFEAIGLCGATSEGSIQYYCDDSDPSAVKLYSATYSDSGCTTLVESAWEYSREFDCSDTLPSCSADGGSGYDIARFEEHNDDTDCTLYSEKFYFVFDSSIGITGNSEHFKVNIYNDSSLERPFDGETIFYYDDAFVDRQARCDVWSEDMGEEDCAAEQRLISYSGTPNEAKTCFPAPCPDNKGSPDIDCAWVAHTDGGPCWWDALNICMSSRHVYHNYDTGNVCKDGEIKCNDEGTVVSYYIYDSSDRSCSGEVLETIEYTNDTYAFDCSLPTCGTEGTTTGVVQFRRYDIFNCGGKQCGSDGCDLETAAYGSYAWIYPEVCDYYPEWCFNYATDCNETTNVGTYPDGTYQYFEEVGRSATATKDNKRSMCWSDSDAPTASPVTAGTPPTAPPVTAPPVTTGTPPPSASTTGAPPSASTTEEDGTSGDDDTAPSGADQYNVFQGMVLVICLSLM